MTGNRLVLKDNFEAMESWCEYVIRTARKSGGTAIFRMSLTGICGTRI